MEQFQRDVCLSSICTMQLHEGVEIDLIDKEVNQVHHPLNYLASMAAEGVASEVFDDLPHWDDDAKWDIQAESLADVIWDDELVHELDTFDPTVYGEYAVSNLGQVVSRTSFGSEDAAYSAFNEVPLLDVTWDVMSTEPMMHEGLLQQLAQGTEERMQCEQVPFEAPIMLEGMHQGGNCCVSGGEHMDRLDSHEKCTSVKQEQEEKCTSVKQEQEDNMLTNGLTSSSENSVTSDFNRKSAVGASNGLNSHFRMNHATDDSAGCQCPNPESRYLSYRSSHKFRSTVQTPAMRIVGFDSGSASSSSVPDMMVADKMHSSLVIDNCDLSAEQHGLQARKRVLSPLTNVLPAGQFHADALSIGSDSVKIQHTGCVRQLSSSGFHDSKKANTGTLDSLHSPTEPIQSIIEISSELFSLEAKKAASTSPPGSNAYAKVQETTVAAQVLLSTEPTPDGETSGLAGGDTELKGTSLGEFKELQSNIHPSVRMQWDPGICTATAWGQAVFRGAGNVMTRR